MAMKQLDRRTFVQGLGAGLAATALPWPRAMAEAAPGDLKFVFVFNQGGWDPTHVFAPLFGNPNVDLEVDAGTATYGNIPIVESLERPSVSSYFAAHHQRSVVLNGVGVRSLSHEICTELMLTGSSAGTRPDWASRLADADAARFTLPHLVLGGPSMPGRLASSVASTGAAGQLNGLLDGALMEAGDRYAGGPSQVQERVLDSYMARRSAARAAGSPVHVDALLTDRYDASLLRAASLKDARYDMDFDPGDSALTQIQAAVDALAMGISRCVSISGPVGWDTHTNIQQQSTNFEALFAGLNTLLTQLQATPGTREPTMADETVVVVLSEMGRTPRLNAAQGKDHWPHTSVLLTGPRLVGSRTVGAFDDFYTGRGVDPATGDVDDAAPPITTEVLGATLLQMADVDLDSSFANVAPITGLLA